MLVGLKRIYCENCEKSRYHETMFHLAKCVVCNTQIQEIEEPKEVEPIQIERFVG